MVKIVVTQDLGLNKLERKELEKLGTVTYYDKLAETPDEWLERCRDAEVICTGKFGLKTDKVLELHDVFFSLPFVGVGFLDKKELERRDIVVSNCPGCNSEAVSEWIVFMMLNLARDFFATVNSTLSITKREPTVGLSGKRLVVLGKGNIGSRVGRIAEALNMHVDYFCRGDNLIDSVRNADFIVDALSQNSTTIGLLGKEFFGSLKHGAYFITPTSSKIWDINAMLEVLDNGTLAGVACDCGSIQTRDTKDPMFVRLASHPKVLATPHIAYNTDVTDRKSNVMMIENISAYLAGKPINLI